MMEMANYREVRRRRGENWRLAGSPCSFFQCHISLENIPEPILSAVKGHLQVKYAIYGITSLTQDEANAKTLLNLNRNHWHIENKLHYVRDMTLKEDQCRIRHHGKAQIMCGVRNTVIALAAMSEFSSVREALDTFGEQRDKALQLVTQVRTE